ncbi:MAG TPA: AarF/UbiB family protein [Acidimicrobiales bacterium]
MSARPADLEHYAFTEDAPWVVDAADLSWSIGIDALRRRTQAQVPELTRVGRLPPGGRVLTVAWHLGRALVGWRLRDRGKGQPASRAGLSRRLREAFTPLGPTYIKLGQILSSGEGVFPPELVAEFKLCRDRVPPESYADVVRVIEDDLGKPLDEIFAWFSPAPIAAASVAQVHAAVLRSGEKVVVKVQRPTVAERVRADLAVMAWLAPHLVGRIPVAALANPPALVELFAETISEELDFRLEAQNMLDVAAIMVELDQRDWVIPRPHPNLVTRRVLVMERLEGFAFDDVVGMAGAGIDTEAVVRVGMIAFLEGAMLHGVFHGDLHGGNLLVLPDGRTGLLDFGITGRMDERKRLAFLQLLIGATTNDIGSQLRALTELGALPPDSDLDELIVDLGLDRPPVDPTTLSPDQLVSEINGVLKQLLAYGARMPKELMLFVKDLVFLDGAIATLAPDLDLFAEIAGIATHMAVTHGERIAADLGHGIDPGKIDLEGVRASFGVTDADATMTYRELKARRELIAKRLGDADRGSRPELG